MLRRLHHAQPESFAFTPANLDWARAQITKYPEGRQASAIIPLLWRAQEQEGWLSRPAIEHVADMLGMAYIRALEVATFYFMFQLQPVGSIAHVQVCGTTSCMICGAEDLIGICQDKIAAQPHALSEDGKFSWEEVECLGACSNAPMVQIGKDYYEDLTVEKFTWILDELAAGRVPTPGPQNGRYASEPQSGLTALMDHEAGRDGLNASARLATDIGDTVKRIDGTEVPLLAPWGKQSGGEAEDTAPMEEDTSAAAPAAVAEEPEAPAKAPAAEAPAAPAAEIEESAPEILSAARDGGADDLKRISGVGPKLEGVLNDLGFYHFDQIAAWGPAEIAWVDARLKFKGRIERDNWVAQAGELAQG
jgi:NADH-quinone oxidoreductase subunit E